MSPVSIMQCLFPVVKPATLDSRCAFEFYIVIRGHVPYFQIPVIDEALHASDAGG